jgi:DNA-binding transcriptional LysR family regulator
VDLRQLAIFVAVAEERSFTRAAERLGTVQSAVSAAVRKLEADLDAELFDRTTRRVELSDAGQVLLPEARRTLTAAASARAAIEDVRGGLRGTVHLGTMQAQATPVLSVAAVIAGFRADHPDVHIGLLHTSGGSSELAEMVRDGRLDLALVGLPAQPMSGLELTPVTSEPFMLACSEAHRLAHRSSVELAALAGERFADMPPSWGTRMAADRAFGRAGITRTIEFEVGDTESVVDLVRHGLAVAVMPASLIRERAGIACVPLSRPGIVFTTSVASPTSRPMSAASRALMEGLLRYVPPDRDPRTRR